MRFAGTVEGLGVSLIDAVMTLIAFLPVLLRLSANVTETADHRRDPLPAGRRRASSGRCSARPSWRSSASGCPASSSATSASRRPTARNSSMARTMPTAPSRRRCANCSPTCGGTTSGSISTTCTSTSAAIFYLQTDNIFPFIVLAPTIVAGKITLGRHEPDPQRLRPGARFVPVSCVKSWTTIVELLSIYKRLRAFEATLHGETLPSIEKIPDEVDGKAAA